MPRITFIERSGRERAIDVPSGGSLMESAVAHGIDGIDALCGGACACGTCHVYVREPLRSALGAPGSDEAALLESTGTMHTASRLGCQLQITEAFDGAVVEVAPPAA